MTLSSNIGQNIRLLRERIDMSQAKLAKALDVSPNTIEKWENGRNNIKADMVVKIADFFNISCDLLLKGGKAENLVLINETGLSDSTIERLKRNNSNEMLAVKYMPITINILVQYPMVLLAIWDYLTDNFPTIETPNQTFFSADTERLSRLHVLDALADMRKEFWRGANNETSKR